MATDIKFNGFGTFYTTLQPPAFSGANSGLLHQVWGSRVAEVSGRARGLAGSVLVSYNSGSHYFVLPDNYFSFTPIIDCSVLLPKQAITYTAPNPKEWTIDFEKWNTGVVSLPIGDYIVPLNQAPVYITIRGIGTGGFWIISSAGLYGVTDRFSNLVTDPVLVYWHAFGC